MNVALYIASRVKGQEPERWGGVQVYDLDLFDAVDAKDFGKQFTIEHLTWIIDEKQADKSWTIQVWPMPEGSEDGEKTVKHGILGGKTPAYSHTYRPKDWTD